MLQTAAIPSGFWKHALNPATWQMENNPRVSITCQLQQRQMTLI